MENSKSANDESKTATNAIVANDENPNNNNHNTNSSTTSVVEENPNNTNSVPANDIDNHNPRAPATRTPFTSLSQVDADLALARTLQEQGFCWDSRIKMDPFRGTYGVKLIHVLCCVGALAITGSLHHVDKDLLGWWLCERQVKSGGLNGRPENLPDVCYSWWVLSSLIMIDRVQWIDKEKPVRFILDCQDKEKGGISDRPDDAVDVFHTYLGVAGLSLLEYSGLKPIDPAYALICQLTS